MPEKLKGVCRLCLSKDGFMFPIFRKDTKSETPFRLKILSCASIEVFADDELPSEICHICAHQVEKSFQFRTICENSDAALRLQLNQFQNNIVQDASTNNLDMGTPDLQQDWSKKINSAHGKGDGVLCFFDNKICESGDNQAGVFICFACSLGFPSYDVLIDHLEKIHSDIRLFPCRTCKLHFVDRNEYKSHMNLKHALDCSKCDHVFKYQKNLEIHLKSHSLEMYSCQYCKKLFDKQFELKQHELSHLDLLCRFCCKMSNTKDEYDEHMKTCSLGYSCKFCHERFQLKKDLIVHVNAFHGDSLHKCKNCNKEFSKWEGFQQHSCNGTDKNLHCKYCQQVFIQVSELESHVSTEHSEELLVCKFCTKSFTLKSALRRHEKSHSGVKPYQCKYCPRKFKDNSSCIVHIRTHTGEHPFQCQECHKDFKQLANLKMHTYRHHKINKITEEKTDILNETEQIYDQLYATSIIDSYSPDGSKTFQQIESDITAPFTESANVLLTEH